MSVMSGRPVLARQSPAQIPAVASRSALDGLAAGFLAAVTYAGSHTEAAELAFNTALRDARENPEHDYDYSRLFLAGLELAKAGLLQLTGGLL